ncbi:MAG: ABC transporter ATP-binding protein [Hyphomicrobiaceae bacterium]|nr:ABC transporter ATP-binding protein [Hyphomicrobiaceae bacterium]
MTNHAIRVQGIAKEYDIGSRETGYKTLRESLVEAAAMPWRRLRRLGGHIEPNAKFWALQDVTFDVEQGEVLGIIGRNGAGKSTLLKVLSRITEPTRGEVQLRGRAASLLEVGTGFHPELTGRENIFLNGTILGMSRAEVKRKFDAIVDFAGVEKFLDLPVKRYSSGMYVRLAFSVAANLDPDILILDEVLAVGDLDFQKKCLDRMKGLSNSHSTILFVSHNMGAIQALCDRCVLLDKGRVTMVGPTTEVIARFVDQHRASRQYVRTAPPLAEPTVMAASLDIEAGAADGQAAVAIARIALRAQAKARIGVWLRFKDALGVPFAFAGAGQFDRADLVALAPGDNELELVVPVDGLAIGDYTVNITTIQPGARSIEDLDDCLSFTIQRAPRPGATRVLEQAWGYGSMELPVSRGDVRMIEPLATDGTARASPPAASGAPIAATNS